MNELGGSLFGGGFAASLDRKVGHDRLLLLQRGTQFWGGASMREGGIQTTLEGVSEEVQGGGGGGRTGPRREADWLCLAREKEYRYGWNFEEALRI